jgi:hypothetical protein
MISTVFSSSSLSWLIGEFFVSMVAISGGVLVFRGLWIENKADKDEYLDVDDFRLSKLKKRRGWKMLMLGIALETVVAGVFAAKEGWEIRQINANTPAKMRVNKIEATAEFMIETNWDDPGTRYMSTFGRFPAVLILSSQPITNRPNSKPPTNHLGVSLFCDDAQWDLMWSNDAKKESRYIITLHFVLLPWVDELSRPDFNRPSEEWIKNLKYFRIEPGFLYGNTVIIYNGRVTLLLNGSVSKTFEIPAQKVDLNCEGGKPEHWYFGNF